jgi:general secretion pathway protein G
MVIIGILAAIIMPGLGGRTKKARITAAKADIRSMSTALTTFEVDNGRYPTNDEGLAALFNPPPNLASTWHGPYVDRQFVNDPWGRPYIYRCPGSQNPHSFDLLSLGEDGQEGSADNIDNWTVAG